MREERRRGREGSRIKGYFYEFVKRCAITSLRECAAKLGNIDVGSQYCTTYAHVSSRS